MTSTIRSEYTVREAGRDEEYAIGVVLEPVTHVGSQPSRFDQRPQEDVGVE
jgi:hypothetical protein